MITHAFACVGRVVSFASLRVVSSRSLVSLASLLCLHVRGRVIAGLRVVSSRSLVSLVSS